MVCAEIGRAENMNTRHTDNEKLRDNFFITFSNLFSLIATAMNVYKNWQLLAMIWPVNGQEQLSLNPILQVDVTFCPLPSIAVQLVQCDVTVALAGAINKAALRSIAPTLPKKSTFSFTLRPPFLPFRGRSLTSKWLNFKWVHVKNNILSPISGNRAALER